MVMCLVLAVRGQLGDSVGAGECWLLWNRRVPPYISIQSIHDMRLRSGLGAGHLVGLLSHRFKRDSPVFRRGCSLLFLV
jgi:hypothetical protein